MDGDVKFRMQAAQLRAMSGAFRKADPGSTLDKLLLEWGTEAVAIMREATPIEEGEPLQRGHPSPGTARASWRFDQEPAQKTVKVTNAEKYVKFLVGGTGKDTGGYIYPNVAPMLVFYAKEGRSGGRLIARERVRGIEPVPELVEAIERLGPRARDLFLEAGVEIVQKIAEFES